MTLKDTLYESKYCKNDGLYLGKVLPMDLTRETKYEYELPIKFNYMSGADSEKYLNNGIRSVGESVVIQVYRDYEYKIDDKIVIENKIKHIKSITKNYINNRKHTIKQYVLVLE